MKRQFKKWGLHSGFSLDFVDSYNVIECTFCGFKHLIPIPSPTFLTKVYTKEFYGKTKPDYFKKQKKDLKWWDMVFEERYEMIEKLLPKAKRSILDIGSGPGFFLKFGKDRGWETRGVEPSISAVKYSRSLGLDVANNFFGDKLTRKLGTFDAVHMHGVLEHLPNPKETIKICYSLLNKGGVLSTSVANDYNPLQLIVKNSLKIRKWWVVPSQHINYFNISSITSLVKLQKFKILDVTTTFPMEIFLLMGFNYIDNDKIGSFCHEKRKNLEFALVKSGYKKLKRKIYKAFAKQNIGRQIELIAQKPNR